MAELVLIYFFTFSIVIFFSYLGVRENNREVTVVGHFRWNKFYFLSLLTLTIFLGTRDGVGVDFYSYKDGYENGTQLFEFGESTEIGQIWLTDILNFFKLDYHSFFIATSFITVLLLFNSFKNFYHLLPIGILIFFVGGMYNFDINGVRQGIAMMAFFNSLRFIKWDGNVKEKLKNTIWFSFYLTIGALFHYSIFIFVPLIFILNKRFLSIFNSRILIILVFIGFFINSVSFLGIFANSFADLFPKYEYYTDLDLMTEVSGFHLGAVFILIANLIPLIFYNKIKSEFPDSPKYFVLYAFGTGMMYAFSEYMVVGRVILYFSLCNIFVFAYTISYFKKYSREYLKFKFLNFSIIGYYIVLFVYSIPKFMEIQIITDYFSLWFIPLTK
ncbi:MAG: EpsG family protein [Paludibacter sp.]|nr:EpsG family protein [Paludibacter sp.]